MLKDLDKLEPGKLQMIMVSAVLLVAVLLVLYVIKPSFMAYQNARESREMLESTMVGGQSLAKERAGATAEVNELSRKLHGDMANLPAEQMEAYVIGRLQKISWNNDIELDGITPSKGRTIQTYEEVLFDVNIIGNYFDIFSWLRQLGNEIGFVVVKKFNISLLDNAADKEPRLNARLTIVSYRLTGQ